MKPDETNRLTLDSSLLEHLPDLAVAAVPYGPEASAALPAA